MFPISAMNGNKVPSCIELVKGLHQCEGNVKAMILRALLSNSTFLEELLRATWRTILSWLDWPCSGLTDDEVLRLRTTVMKVKEDTSWFDKNNPGEILIMYGNFF